MLHIRWPSGNGAGSSDVDLNDVLIAAKRSVVIDLGDPFGEFTVERGMLPLKYYHDFNCEIESYSYAFGPCWEPVIAQCNLGGMEKMVPLRKSRPLFLFSPGKDFPSVNGSFASALVLGQNEVALAWRINYGRAADDGPLARLFGSLQHHRRNGTHLESSHHGLDQWY